MTTKKLFSILLLGSVLLSSCSTPSNALTGSMFQNTVRSDSKVQNTAKTGTGILENVFSSLQSGVAVTEQELLGTWHYNGVDAVFDSQNLLAQAGGMVMAAKLENQIDEKMEAFGIRKGTTTFTFKADKTFTAIMNGKTFSGTYQLNKSDKVLILSAMGGFFTFRPHIVRTSRGISLLFKADKLLALLNATSGLLEQSGTIASMGGFTSMLNNYTGLRLGLQLKK